MSLTGGTVSKSVLGPISNEKFIFQIIIFFKKAVKEIQQVNRSKLVAKIDAHDNFFCGSKLQK